MSRNQALAQIDLDAIEYNFNHVRDSATGSQVMAVIKADAYGHGAIEVARKLGHAGAFGVARVSEGVKLREAGIHTPICLLEGVSSREEVNLASIYEFQLVIHDQSQLKLLQSAGARRPVWLKFDTGMGRLGFRPEDAASVLGQLSNQALLGIMTHLASASDPASGATSAQVSSIGAISSELKKLNAAASTMSIANSAGILAHPESLAEWVRPGIMLYGATPMDDLLPIPALHPAMTFSAPVISIKGIRKGESVGYGGLWVADRDTRIAVVAAGYADGYPRETKPATPVLIDGHRRSLVGRVSMDMICVALEKDDHVDVGDRAILWGDGLPVEEVAACADTITYTLLSGITQRVTKEYRGKVKRG